MLHKMRVDGKRDRDKSEVPCPVQMKDYCKTLHLIDKGNGAKAHYDMGGKSRKHNWSPTLVFRLWNMSLNNAYLIYKALHKQYTSNRKLLSMKQCVKDLTFDLLQTGESMRQRKAGHPETLSTFHQFLDGMEGRLGATQNVCHRCQRQCMYSEYHAWKS